MDVNPVFWNQQQRCPAVYVAGACLQTTTSATVATYGVAWGIDDLRNRSGPAIGDANQLRANLSGMLKALEIAVHQRVPKLVFFTNSKTMSDELDLWDETSPADQCNFKNQDLLIQISAMRSMAKEYVYWLALVEQNCQEIGFQHALDWAESLLAGKKPVQIPTSPILPSLKEPSDTTVAIYGHVTKTASESSYAIYWGCNDKRNKVGTVHHPLYSQKAEFLALNIVLSTAYEMNITRLRIQTRVQNVQDIYYKFKNKPASVKKEYPYTKLMEDCAELAKRMEEVQIEHVRPDVRCRALDEAKRLIMSNATEDTAGLLSQLKLNDADKMVSVQTNSSKSIHNVNNKDNFKKQNDLTVPAIVHIGGACREMGQMANARSMSSVFFVPHDPRNRQSLVHGVGNIIRTKLFSVKEALEIAIEYGIHSLIVRIADQVVFDTINCKNNPFVNKDVVRDIGELTKKIKNLKFEFTPDSFLVRMADLAAAMELGRFE